MNDCQELIIFANMNRSHKMEMWQIEKESSCHLNISEYIYDESICELFTNNLRKENYLLNTNMDHLYTIYQLHYLYHL